MSSPQLEENQRNAIGALFQTIEINPVNLFKMKESIPDGYITKIFVNKAFEGISPKDLTTTVIKDCVESMKTDVWMNDIGVHRSDGSAGDFKLRFDSCRRRRKNKKYSWVLHSSLFPAQEESEAENEPAFQRNTSTSFQYSFR